MELSDDDMFAFSNVTYTSVPENDVDINVFGVVVYSVLLYIGLCANIWMIWTLRKTWKSNTRLNFFLLALAVADIFYLSLQCGMRIGMDVTYSWEAGEAMCVLVMIFFHWSFSFGNWVLVSLDIDNTFTVIRNKPSKGLRLALVAVFLVLAILTSITSGVTFTAMDSGSSNFCMLRSDWGSFPSIYQISSSIFNTWLPILLCLVFGIISLVAFCATKGKRQYMSTDSDEENEMKNIGQDVAMTSVFNLIFILFWTPSVPVYDFRIHWFSLVVYEVIGILVTLNSVVRPLIYAAFYCCNKRRNKVSPGL